MRSLRHEILAVLLALVLIGTVPVIRTQSNFVLAGSLGANLIGVIYGDEGVDADSDGLFDYLKVSVQVNVTEPGAYRVSISGLLSSDSSYISIYNDKSMHLNAGLQVVNMSLDGTTIYLSGLNPVNISSIYLYDTDWNWLGNVYNVPLSHEYSYSDFDPPGAVLTGNIYDEGIDTDSDGLFNYLQIGVEINVTDFGDYRVEVSGLLDSSSNYINAYDSKYEYLDVGLQLLNLSLDGQKIYASGFNPAYVNSIWFYDANYTYSTNLYNVALSHEYSYSDFDPPGAVLTGNIYDEGIDTDSDGLFNYLQIGVEINVTDFGDYRVEVSGLLDSSSNYIDVWDSASSSFDIGIHVLNVSLDGVTIYISGFNPQNVSYIYLYTYNDYSYLYNIPLLHEYTYTDFDPPGAVLTGVISDSGVDTDGDGEFNYLQVGVEVNVTEAGYYEVGVSRFLDVNYSYIYVYDSKYQYLYDGPQVVNLSLNGLQVHLSGLNPSYVDYIWLRDENYRRIGSLDDVLLSREYNYTEFEGPNAVFTGTVHDQGIDSDSDGLFNYLVVGVEVNVTEAGEYSIYMSGLLDADFNYIDVWGSQYVYLDVGVHVLNVSLDGLRIRLLGLNPRYVDYISLRDENYNYLDTLDDVPLSREYSYSEFEAPGAVLTGVIFDQGVDTDADGKYDYLQIGVQVNVTDPGNYYVSVSSLRDSDFNYIYVYDSNFTFLDAGQQIVYIYLEGPRIYLSGRNPKYISYISLQDETYTYYDSLEHVPLSREYSYTEFDPPAAMLTGNIYDHGVDTDSDGAFNYLEIGVEINVTKAGTCSVSVSELRDADWNWINVYSSTTEYLEVGIQVLNISLDGQSIYSSRRNPKYVNYISLSADYYDSLHDVSLSREYLYTEFDFPAILTGVIFDQGVDTDGDGFFDYLEIGIQVNVSDAGTYRLYVSGLRDPDSYSISVWDSKTIYLDAGVQIVNLYLYGPQIHVSRRNPANVSYISLTMEQYTYYYSYYDTLYDVSLSREYSYTEFDAPLMDVETKFVVHPDGRVAVEGALNYTNMMPENTPKYTTAQGFFNLTRDELSSQASAGLTLHLPDEIASEFPFNSTTTEMLAQYSNGLLDFGINSTMVLPQFLASQYPFNSTDGTLKATYSGGILNIEVEGNTTLPQLAAQQFPFNATDISVVGTYSSSTLDGTITFSVLDGFTFDDVNVDFTGNETDFTLNGTMHVVFNVPLGDLIIRNETELVQLIAQLKSELPEIIWNMTDGLLNVTNLDIDYILNGVGASVMFEIDIHGDFVRTLSYMMSGGRNEMLLHPVLNEAYQSVQSGSFDVQYSHATLEASLRLTFSYDLKRLMDYILTSPTGTIPYVMTSYSMSPTLWTGDIVMVEEVSNASDIVADPETGDIIAFYNPSDTRYIVIHRAINKTYTNGTLYFTTKGDANWYPDSWSVPEDLVTGRVVRRIPLLGFLVSYPYLYYPYYYSPYPQNTTGARLSLLKAVYDSVENMSVHVSYSSIDRRFDFRLTQVSKLEALINESVLILPDILPPETPSEIRTFVESLFNITYASVDSASVSFIYESGRVDFDFNAVIKGDITAEVNYVKDLYFQLMGTQYSRYNVTVPWQFDFINQTKFDISNFEISAKLGETSFEGKIRGLTLIPPMDALNATHFKLEKFFNITAPQYPWQREFPGQYQKLQITIEGSSNATHGVTLFRDPQTVPEPDETASHQMIWYNQTLSSLKDLVFNIRELNQFDLGWIVGKVVDADSLLPIAGASITADGRTTTTDANGCYVISNATSGDYVITVSASSYATESKNIYHGSGVTTTINFELIPPGAIDGMVIDASTSLPIGSVNISLNGYSTTTNADGYYNISDVYPGDYTVTASATGYLGDSKSVHVDPHVTTTVNFELLPAGTLSVTTTPVAGEVFVNGTSWGVAPQSRTVMSGTYNITFGSITGYRTPTWQLATVQKGVETTISGVYEPITGTLKATTTPVSGEVFVNGVSWGMAPQSRVIQIGTHNVSFGDVSGYYTPKWQLATVSQNEETVVEGIFEEMPTNGTLSVTTSPFSSEVFVNGTSWGFAPQSKVVYVGSYNVSFAPVASYYTPSWQLVSIGEDTETVVEGVYEPITGTLTITTTPVDAEVFVNGTSWGIASQSRVVQIGVYIVTFGDVEGYYSPSDQIASVYENVETGIEGVYTRAPTLPWGLVTVGIAVAVIAAVIVAILIKRKQPYSKQNQQT